MNNKSQVAILVPAYYKRYLDNNEIKSIKVLTKILSKYDKYFIIPSKAIVDNKYKKHFRIRKFNNKYFLDRNSYNKLLLNKKFYNTFTKYKYILIYQLDALIFSDQLTYWCNKNFDYIAAPWFNSIIAKLSHKKGSPISGGNGGFSLRNVQSALKVLDIVNRQAKRTSNNSLVQKIWFFWAVIMGISHKKWLNAPADNYPFNEDGFWSLEAPKYLKTYKIAPFKEALNFAFERFPEKCFKLNNNKLPFGVHAWAKYDKKFWKSFLSDYAD